MSLRFAGFCKCSSPLQGASKLRKRLRDLVSKVALPLLALSPFFVRKYDANKTLDSIGVTVPIRRGLCCRGQLEVARLGAVQQASSRRKADRFVLSSVVDFSSVREHYWCAL